MESTKKNIINRRNFMRLVVIGAGTSAVGLYAVGQMGQVNYADPAYLYWNKNSKGSLNLENYLVLCASLAPSAHNTQPWKFLVEKDEVSLFADTQRNLGSADPDKKMLLVSVGCALENLSVAASHLGKNIDISISSDEEFNKTGLCAKINIIDSDKAAPNPLFESIFKRQTTRAPYVKIPNSNEFTNSIAAHGEFESLKLHWFESDSDLQKIGAIHSEAVRSFVGNDQAYRDSLKWWRYSRPEILEKRDGISIFTSAAPSLIKQYFQYAVEEKDMVSDFGKNGEIDLMDKLFNATPLWGVITSSQKSNQARINSGQLLERVYLEATRQDYRVMPIAYVPQQLDHADKFKKAFNIPDSDELLAIFRVGQAELCEKSVRRPLNEIIV